MSDSIQPIVAPGPGETIQLMVTCLGDAFFPDAGLATADVLEALGYRVEFRKSQTCCAQPAFNTGDRTNALKVARHTIGVFAGAGPVVVPSGSCAAMVRWGYPQLFRGLPDADAAAELAARTWEVSELLNFLQQGEPWPGSYSKSVALHRSCHMRELSEHAGPERLLGSISGIRMLEVERAEQCCGFGGTFAVTFPETSKNMGRLKLDTLEAGPPEEILSSDMGCVMHLDGLARKQAAGAEGSAPIPMRHFVEVLRDSLIGAGV